MLMTSHYCHHVLVDVDCFNLWSNIKNMPLTLISYLMEIYVSRQLTESVLMCFIHTGLHVFTFSPHFEAYPDMLKLFVFHAM